MKKYEIKADATSKIESENINQSHKVYSRDLDQEKFLKKKYKEFSQFSQLWDRLMELVPDSMVACQSEGDYQRLVKDGKLIEGSLIFIPMKQSRCHSNSVYLWSLFPDRIQIQTGWALSNNDGIWRQHTWAFDKVKKRIIETTDIRSMYYGITLNSKEEQAFKIELGYLEGRMPSKEILLRKINRNKSDANILLD